MKPLSGTAKYEADRWVVRTANGIEIGSCHGAPTLASAIAAVGLAAEGSFEFGELDEAAKTVTWSAKPLEVSA